MANPKVHSAPENIFEGLIEHNSSITNMCNGVYRILMHFEGVNGSRRFIDNGAYSNPIYTKSINYYGSPVMSTSQKKFGNSSLYLDGTSYLEVGFLYNIGTENFSLDFHVRFNSVAGTQTLVDIGNSASGIQLSYYNGTWTASIAGTSCTFSHTPSVDTWYHIALSRTSGSVRFFVEGTKTGTTQTASGSLSTGSYNCFIGATKDGSNRTNAYIDEFRFVSNNWSSYQTDSNIAVPTTQYDPFGIRITTNKNTAQPHQGKVLVGDSSGNFNPQRMPRTITATFALPESVANTSKYFYSNRGPGATQEDNKRSGNPSGMSYANACSPFFSPINGIITSATLVVQGVGVNNGSVTYPVIYRADIYRVGFSAEHDPNINGGSPVQLNFKIGSGVGTYSVSSTDTRVVLNDLNIPIIIGDPIAIKFINGSGASGAAIIQMSFITIVIEETF